MEITNTVVNDDLNYIYNKIENIDKLSGKTILITGCAGFLGYYFLNFLLFHFDKLNLGSVIGIDNFKLGRPKWLDNLISDNEERLNVYTFDIAKDNISDINNSDEVDYIIHMASIASPTFYRKYPIETVDANIWGLRKLLDFYNNKAIQGFLFFSSSEVYGNPDKEKIPTKENYCGNVNSIGPRACYDEAKRFGETLCYLFSIKHGTPIRIVRPFNNYGPGMNIKDKRVPADFAKAVIENKDIEILSDGNPTRTFCYISDAIMGYLKALLYSEFDVFNIGIHQPEISIIELAKIYKKYGANIWGYDKEIIFSNSIDTNYLTDNPDRRCPNINKAREKLGYNPEILVESGVEKYLLYLKEELS